MKKVLVLKWEIYVGWVSFRTGYIDQETDSHFHIKGIFGGTWYQKNAKSITTGFKYEEIINLK